MVKKAIRVKLTEMIIMHTGVDWNRNTFIRINNKEDHIPKVTKQGTMP